MAIGWDQRKLKPPRDIGQRTIEAYPNVVLSVRANRKFLARAVRFPAGDEGIRQFPDGGTGIPSANNTHEVAQRFAPDARIVYVDNRWTSASR
jgi:hypothetical protein